jgi:hypothetical protein
MKKLRLFGLVLAAAVLLGLPSLASLPWHMVPPLRLSPFTLHAQSNGALNVINMHAMRLSADCTDGTGGTTLQNPCANVTTNAGPQITFWANPSAQVYYLDCDLGYSQATVVADAYGVQFVGTAPTSTELGGVMATNATTFAAGTPAIITTTTATNVIAGTPAVTTTLYAHIGGTVEIPATNQDIVMNLLVSQATAANVVVTKRGSICRWWAVQ